MNSNEYEFSQNITKKLLNHPLSKAFLEPIPKNAEWAEDYFKIIQIPMDLSTVQNKLNNNQYKSLIDWEKDINLIWNNGKKFNLEKSTIYVCADILERKCEKWFLNIPKNEFEISELKIKKINEKITELLSIEIPEFTLSARLTQEEIENFYLSS